MITQNIKNTTLLFFLLISTSTANQGTFITEPFDCETELANYGELGARLYTTPKTDLKYEIFVNELKLVMESIQANTECNATMVRGSYEK